MEDKLPKNFGTRYLLERQLSAYNNIITYYAKDLVLQRNAIIRCSPGFEQEAKIMAQCRHPNVALVYEYGDQPQPHLVLEYIAGKTLFQWIIEQKLTTGQIVTIIERCADAIYNAHSQGIWHLYLTTKNIILPHRHEPKIIDFSFAVAIKPLANTLSTQQADEKINKDITTTSCSSPSLATESDLLPIPTYENKNSLPQIIIKQPQLSMPIPNPDYLAPELFPHCSRFSKEERWMASKWCRYNKARVGPTSDVYALGAILYHALAGCLPFATLDAQLKFIPPLPLQKLDPTISKSLEAICCKCLDPLPQRRYANAGELAQDLRNFQTNRPIQARRANWITKSRQWLMRHPRLSASLLLLLATNFLILLLFSGPKWWQLYQSHQQQKIHKQEVSELEQKLAHHQKQYAEMLKKIKEFDHHIKQIESQSQQISIKQLQLQQKSKKLLEKLQHIQGQTIAIQQQFQDDKVTALRNQEWTKEQLDAWLVEMQKRDALQKRLLQQIAQEEQEYILNQEYNLSYARLRDTENKNNTKHSTDSAEQNPDACANFMAAYVSDQYIGQAWKFEVQYINTGLVPLTNIDVTIQWNSLLQCKFAEAKPAINPQQATWQILELAPGQSKKFAVYMLANKEGMGSLLATSFAREGAKTRQIYTVQIHPVQANLSLNCPDIAYNDEKANLSIALSNPLTLPLTNITLSLQWDDSCQMLSYTGNPQLENNLAIWKIVRLEPKEEQVIQVQGTCNQGEVTSNLHVQADNTQGISITARKKINWKNREQKRIALQFTGAGSAPMFKGTKTTLESYLKIENISQENLSNLTVRLETSAPIVWNGEKEGIWRYKPLPATSISFQPVSSQCVAYLIPEIKTDEVQEFNIVYEVGNLGAFTPKIKLLQADQQLLEEASYTTQILGVPFLELTGVNNVTLSNDGNYVTFPFFLQNTGNGSSYNIQLCLSSLPPAVFNTQEAMITIAGGTYTTTRQEDKIICRFLLPLPANQIISGNIRIPAKTKRESTVSWIVDSASSEGPPISKSVTVTFPP